MAVAQYLQDYTTVRVCVLLKKWNNKLAGMRLATKLGATLQSMVYGREVRLAFWIFV